MRTKGDESSRIHLIRFEAIRSRMASNDEHSSGGAMPQKKIAVFNTSHLYTDDESAPIVFSNPDGKTLRTSGCLERAIRDGYEVYVISTRSRASLADRWWLSMVKLGNVSFSGYATGDARCPVYIAQYRTLYDRLGLPWSRFSSWMEARDALKRHRVRLGFTFHPENDEPST